MKALVVYDSFFGNTEKAAQEIGKALSKYGDVNVIKVDQYEASYLNGIKLLVVGSPTRAFSASPNIKSFLKNLPGDTIKGMNVAAFDTRFTPDEKSPKFLVFMIKIFGYAAEKILKGMVRKGGNPAVPENWFAVSASEGPLMDGEMEHAAQWADAIVEAIK